MRYGETIMNVTLLFVTSFTTKSLQSSRTLRDEYDKLENLLRIKGIDPDEFLNQKQHNNHDDDDEDENASDCSECSCEECCDEDCCTEKPSSDNQSADKAGESSSEQSKEACASTSKESIQQTSGKTPNDEHKRSGKDRLNVNQFAVLDKLSSLYV